MAVIHDPENLEFLKLHTMLDFTNRDVLEIGCGGGRLTALYHEMVRRVIGIDLYSDVLEIAQDYVAENADFVLANSLNLPFRKSSFDVVIFAWSL